MNIGYGKQSINKNDINEVVKTLKSNFLTQGPKVKEFEKSLNNYFGSKYCCVVNNGTSALFLSGLVMNWKLNDIILTTSLTFVASANSIIYNNATPDFVDINFNNYTIDLDKLEEKIKFYRKKRKKVKAVIGVDFAGHPCDWPNLRYLANKYNFLLINDNCHALGAKLNNNIKYAIKYSDIVTQSFHPVKNITTGEGGAILSNSKEYIKKLYDLRMHGIIKDKSRLNKYDGPWYYDVHQLGYNFRLADFQCALGISQLKRVNSFIKKRNSIANYYNNFLSEIKHIQIPQVSNNVQHAYHLYTPLFNFKKTKINKIKFYNMLKSKGINLMVHYVPIPLFTYYKKKYNLKNIHFLNSIKYYERSFSLPIFPDLKSNKLKFICSVIKNTFK